MKLSRKSTAFSVGLFSAERICLSHLSNSSSSCEMVACLYFQCAANPLSAMSSMRWVRICTSTHTPVGPHHGRMQRLVAVGLGHRDPVAQPVGFRGVDVRDGGVYLPALGLFRGERQRLEHDADGKQVVYLLEGDLFALHLAPYRVDALYPPRDFVVDVVAVEPRDDRGVELADELLARRLGSLSFCVISAYCCGNRYFMQRSSSSLLIE